MVKRSQHVDRRHFLAGAAGAVLALPMLQRHAPRLAYAQDAPPPKRLVVVFHGHGRCAGNGYESAGAIQDNWSPLSSTGTYPETGELSPMLAALGDIRNEIVTIDGIDNLVRHGAGALDGHLPAARMTVNCQLPGPGGTPGGPSIDYVVGQRLRASAAQRTALIFPASPTSYDYSVFSGEGGTQPAILDAHPANTLLELFGQATAASAPAALTLRDRLAARRLSILDSVADSYQSLSAQANAFDRARLEQHAEFIRALETRLSGNVGGVLAQGCLRPDEAAIPSYGPSDGARGALDHEVTPWQIENLVMSLACDVTRVATLHFQVVEDPTFDGEFAGSSPITAWHTMVHETPDLSGGNTGAITQAFQFYGKMFTRLVQRLGEVVDTDGSRLLDNTLVLWMSEMGYGSAHYDFNNPIVLAGLGSAFSNGQGRHLVIPERRSLGDLFAQVLRMFGGSDTTFGLTGTLGDTGQQSLNEWASYGFGFAQPSTPLHLGELDL